MNLDSDEESKLKPINIFASYDSTLRFKQG